MNAAPRIDGRAPAKTPWLGAEQGIGEGQVAFIFRYKLDGTRCGMVQGRHAEWNWAYRVRAPWGEEWDAGRWLREARTLAACCADTIVEHWPNGKSWKRGARGGLKGVRL